MIDQEKFKYYKKKIKRGIRKATRPKNILQTLVIIATIALLLGSFVPYFL